LSRWGLVEQQKKANGLIEAYCKKDDRRLFIDVGPAMLGEDGKPKPELFVKDGLHMTSAGYEVWNKLLLPHIK
jgi:lysophospholipase L1-like esterase